MREIKEGYIPFKGYQTYYRIVGKCENGKLPLLTLRRWGWSAAISWASPGEVCWPCSTPPTSPRA